MDKKDVSVKDWLLEVTGCDDEAIAKEKVQRGLGLLDILPRIGILSILVGPGGLLNLVATQNIANNPESLDDLQMALVQAQQNVIMSKQQIKGE